MARKRKIYRKETSESIKRTAELTHAICGLMAAGSTGTGVHKRKDKPTRSQNRRESRLIEGRL